jgi:hypothetical protein
LAGGTSFDEMVVEGISELIVTAEALKGEREKGGDLV